MAACVAYITTNTHIHNNLVHACARFKVHYIYNIISVANVLLGKNFIGITSLYALYDRTMFKEPLWQEKGELGEFSLFKLIGPNIVDNDPDDLIYYICIFFSV